MKNLALVFVLGLFSTFFITKTAYANHGGLKVCNERNVDLYVNIVYKQGIGLLSNRWTADGRYFVKSGKCEYLAKPFSAALVGYLGVRIKKSNGYVDSMNENPKTTWKTSGRFGSEANKQFCTKEQKFEYKGTLAQLASCRSGFRKQLFQIRLDIDVIPIGQHYDNTIYLF